MPYRNAILANKKVNELSPEAINTAIANINCKSLEERNYFFKLKVKYLVYILKKYLIDCKFKGRSKDFELPVLIDYRHLWFALLEFHKAGWEEILVNHTPFVPEFHGANFSFKNAEFITDSSPRISFSTAKTTE